MYVGETIQVSRAVTQASPWQATSPALTVTAPDLTTTSPTVTVSPGSASVTQTLSALVTPALVGTYKLKWQYSDASGETITLIDTRYATWTDAKDLVLTRLQCDDSAIADTVFEAEFASISRRILSRWTVIGTGVASSQVGLYDAIVGNDQYYFDEAAALLVCARLVGPLNSGGGASDVVQQKTGDTTVRLAETARDRADGLAAPGDLGGGSGGYAGQSERIRWYREAAELIGQMSAVQIDRLASAAGFSPFTVSGPTRSMIGAGYPQTLLSSVIQLFTDDYQCIYQDDGDGAGVWPNA